MVKSRLNSWMFYETVPKRQHPSGHENPELQTD